MQIFAYLAPLLIILASAVMAYLIGTMPIGRILAEKSLNFRPRGASLPRVASAINVMVDMAKGLGAVLLVAAFGTPEAAAVAMLMVYFGHQLPWRKAWGKGAGTATLLGALFGLDPVLGFTALCAWLAIFHVYRLATPAILAAASLTPLIAYFTYDHPQTVFLLIVAGVIFWQRRACVREILFGPENEVGL